MLGDIPDLSPEALGLPDDARKRKICVGLSGGVDSSVAAMLLKEAGYDVFALFMQNWHDVTGTLHGECEWEEDRSVAEMVARRIGIPFHFVDLSDTYRSQVVDYMFGEYEKGRTPNPDVMCNSKIKFAAFLQAAGDLGAEYVATGHYCRKAVTEDGMYRILAGNDPNKDQSYFLCRLTQEQLSRAVFPIGEIIKPEVRRLAREGGLPSAEKKDSQGICFVGKVDLPVFLQQKLKARRGQVVEIFPDFYDTLEGYPGYGRGLSLTEEEHRAGEDIIFHAASGNNGVLSPETLTRPELEALASVYRYSPSDGKVIGEHTGAQYYTIGQRKGLNIGGHKDHIFIISIDIGTNTIYVGEGHHHPGLLRKALAVRADEVHWIRPDLEMKEGEKRDYLIRIRYRQPLQKAVMYRTEDTLYIVFDEHQRGISPGQFAVWYDTSGEMLGSGVIR